MVSKKNNRKISRKIRKSKKLKGGSLSRAERARRAEIAAAAANRRRSVATAAANRKVFDSNVINDFPTRAASATVANRRRSATVAKSAASAPMIRSQSYPANPSIINGRQIRRQLSLNSSFDQGPLTGRRNNRLIISKAKRNQRYNTRYLMNETEKRLMPFPETRVGDPIGYPIEGKNWSYEENPADGNCLYYSVLRALERRISPNINPLKRGEMGEACPENNLYNKYAVYILKKLARDYSETNRALMTPLVLNPAGHLERVMKNEIYGEPISIQALSNLLNCCICVFIREGIRITPTVPPQDSNAWQIYIPDSEVGIPDELAVLDEGFNLPMRGGIPSYITLTEKIDELQYTAGHPIELATNGYHTDPIEYRNRIKGDRLRNVEFVEQHCKEPLYISSIGDPAGHFVALEYLHERNKKRHFTSGYTTEPLPKEHQGTKTFEHILKNMIKIYENPAFRDEMEEEINSYEMSITQPPSQPQPLLPSDNFAPQLAQLAEMGFTDEAQLLPLLVRHGGQVERVMGSLF